MTDRDSNILAEFEGKAVKVIGQMLAPARYGKTRLTLYPMRLVEETRRPVAALESEILLSELHGATLAVRGNATFMSVAGILFIAAPSTFRLNNLAIPMVLYCLSGLFVLLYLFAFKNQFLIFHGGKFTQQVTIAGNEESSRDFMEEVLAQAEQVKRDLRRGKKRSAGPKASGVRPAR
jgi:hypothetical protein